MKNHYMLFFVLLAFTQANCQSVDYRETKGSAAQGYDVVSYFEEAPQEGKEKYSLTYDEVKFKFANEENKQTFKADPEKYIPQYGGWCAYAMAVNGKKVNIDPMTYEIRDEKLYLFYNKFANNTLESWKNETPEKLVIKADENWKNAKTKK